MSYHRNLPFLAHFGPWAYGPQHGFAKICRWEVEKQPEPYENGDIEAIFSVVDSPFTKQMWNYRYFYLIVFLTTLLLY